MLHMTLKRQYPARERVEEQRRSVTQARVSRACECVIEDILASRECLFKDILACVFKDK